MSHMVESLISLMGWWLTHSLKVGALNVTYGGVTQITQVVVVVALLTWQLGHLVTCRCRRDVGANVSMLNHVVVVAVDEGRRWHLVARLHDRREFPMLGHLPWGASEDGSVSLARR